MPILPTSRKNITYAQKKGIYTDFFSVFLKKLLYSDMEKTGNMIQMSSEEMRLHMVQCQLMPNGITHIDILNAFLNTPREPFVSRSDASHAYLDAPLTSTSGTPFYTAHIQAKMLQHANVSENSRILIIGAGHGYTAALCAKMCRNITLVEQNETHQQSAKRALLDVNVTHVNITSIKHLKNKDKFEIILNENIQGADIPWLSYLSPTGEFLSLCEDEKPLIYAKKVNTKNEHMILFDTPYPATKKEGFTFS